MDEGGGARNLPPMKGRPALAPHIDTSLMTDEFDMSFFKQANAPIMVTSCRSRCCARTSANGRLPLQMVVLQLAARSARRFYKLGQTLRCVIECYPEDIKVANLTSGGFSRQVHGERSGLTTRNGAGALSSSLAELVFAAGF